MAQRTTQCPNCGANNPTDAQRCAICATSLLMREEALPRKMSIASPPLYSSEAGEDDLMARGILSSPLAGILGLFLCIVLSAGLGGLAVYLVGDNDDEPAQAENVNNPNTPAVNADGTVIATPIPPSPLPTNTRPAPPLLPTVTPLPPSATPSPTPGPCIQVAQAGDSVYSMAIRCGHKHLSIVPVIVEANVGLTCDSCLREGQTLEIPWPTPTFSEADAGDGSSADDTSGETGDTSANMASSSDDLAVNEFGTPDALVTLFVEPTLRPGLAWHTVSGEENMIIIAQVYNTDAQVLSELNPEVDFLQCDFGQRYGGPNCLVILYPGQQLRVPAPTATPTVPPTPSGSETPTPSPTATFNVPQAFQPEEGTSFDASTLITLRWTASGTLATNEVYLITVRNIDTDRSFQAQTTELYFVLPSNWQPTSDRTQNYEWTVAIATIDGGRVTSTRQQTTPRHFMWRGR